VNLHDAYVLHSRAYRETSLLVDLFSYQAGRISALAKGVRASKSALRSRLQPFTQIEVGLYGKRDLKLITTVESAQVGCELKGKALYSAFYLNEILMRLIPLEDPIPGLYASYGSTLLLLRNADIYDEFILRLFERDLLAELGFGLQLEFDVDTGRQIDANEQYQYLLEEGPRLAARGIGRAGISVSGATLQALKSGVIAPSAAKQKQVYTESKHLMRSVLRLYLGDKPLKSRELFK